MGTGFKQLITQYAKDHHISEQEVYNIPFVKWMISRMEPAKPVIPDNQLDLEEAIKEAESDGK